MFLVYVEMLGVAGDKAMLPLCCVTLAMPPCQCMSSLVRRTHLPLLSFTHNFLLLPHSSPFSFLVSLLLQDHWRLLKALQLSLFLATPDTDTLVVQ